MLTEKKIGYVYNLAVDMGAGRALTLSGNFDTDATKETMNTEVDKLMAVANRQKARAEIPGVESAIRVSEAQLAAQIGDIAGIEKEFEGKRPPTQVENAMKSAKIQIDRIKQNIIEQQTVLEQLKKEAE